MTAEALPFAVDTACTRCGAPLQFRNAPRNPDARLLRKSLVPKGYCASCAMANWLQHMEPLNMVIARKGPEILLDRRQVDQMSNVLAAGCADATPQEIDWVSVVINWDLPFRGHARCRTCKEAAERKAEEATP